jgi:hypothetical protein
MIIFMLTYRLVFIKLTAQFSASVAQSAEHLHGKEGVTSSILVGGFCTKLYNGYS